MIPASEFTVVEFDLNGRFIKKITLWEFNRRRKEEFKYDQYNPNLILLGVFETEEEANECVKEHQDIDKLIAAIVNGQNPFDQ